MSSTLSSLTPYFEAMKATLREKFIELGIDFPTIELLDDQEFGELETPALLIAVDELGENKAPPSDGSYPETLNIAVLCILSSEPVNDSSPAMEVINLASLVKRFVRREKWGLRDKVFMPKEIEAFPAGGKKGPKGYRVWQVNFLQEIKLGEPAMNEEAFMCTGVYFGVNPENDDDYRYIGEINE
ncbi:hypothetical protein [Pseudoalteromonas sp. MMG024]|uniref:hypothetical protein n=1 Tax=Pseudoalteromonas sp. MMG024 TaxID=2909980 RepID=UPI001F29220A|nr:hypothetical protein [Pseudoalteromonas sp. MMG024]MCF6459045.1 hypothetical protein [Pseudoalteromonas sp. MMG024]